MKTLLYSLVAAAALTLGGAFTSNALAAGNGHGHHGHGHNHGHSHHNHGHNHGHSHHNHGHNHFHGGSGYGNGYGNAYGGGYYRPVYPYQQNGIYFRGSNFGVRIGF